MADRSRNYSQRLCEHQALFSPVLSDGSTLHSYTPISTEYSKGTSQISRIFYEAFSSPVLSLVNSSSFILPKLSRRPLCSTWALPPCIWPRNFLKTLSWSQSQGSPQVFPTFGDHCSSLYYVQGLANHCFTYSHFFVVAPFGKHG